MKLTEEMAKLETWAGPLNKASDDLSKLVKIIEDRIDQLHLGVEAFVIIDERNEFGLGYGRPFNANNRWCLYIKRGEDVWEWQGSPRKLRIRTVQALPLLLNQMQAQAGSLIRQIEGATDELRKMLMSENTGGPGTDDYMSFGPGEGPSEVR